jgi:tetratricopeptide (TPR) repeat protein
MPRPKPRTEKTVFLSYRRTNAAWALAISQNLTYHGFDVFFDFNGIASGDFETVILENIRARAHFIVLLTPSALERCGEPGDWLRREIEMALNIRSNIVPITLEGFNFSTPAIAGQLTGNLAALKRYNALTVPVEYFDAAMERLRNTFLNVSLDAVPHPASIRAAQAARKEQAAIFAAPRVTKNELLAQQWFERAFNATNYADELHLYGEAIRLKPDYTEAFNNRGIARAEHGDLKGAIEDYSHAIRLDPTYANVFNSRGVARRDLGDTDGAMQDYTLAIRFKPTHAEAFNNRAIEHAAKGDFESALKDWKESIRLKPDFAAAFGNRGMARSNHGDLDGALEDFNHAIRLDPTDPDACDSRATVHANKGDLDKALLDYNRAIHLKPDYINAHWNRAELWEKLNKPAEAIADYQHYLELGGGERDGDTEAVKKIIKKLQDQMKTQ